MIGNLKKQRVLVDVDGVLADLVGSLCGPLGKKPSDFSTHGFDKVLTSGELEQVEQLMSFSWFARGLEWHEGARQLLSLLLADKLNDVYVVTAAFTKSRTWESDRRDWLRDFVSPERVLFVPAGAKAFVRGDVLIEDNLSTVNAWLAENPEGKAFLVNRPWNQGAVPDRCHRLELQ